MADSEGKKDSKAVECHPCILAPMVRIGSLGFRELCAQHGADAVFTEEVVGAKLLQCTREVRSFPHVTSEVIEYVCYEPWKNALKRSVVLSMLSGPRTTPTILQLGVADPAVASKIARNARLLEDVDGFDLNMGCPKRFSVINGFGAVLMKKPEVAGGILLALREGANSLSKPLRISLKCRLLSSSPEETVHMLCSVLQAARHSSGHRVIHAITIHARTIDQRSETPPLLNVAQEVVRLCRSHVDTETLQLLFAGIEFTLNGSLLNRRDMEETIKKLGTFSGGMLARSAMCDPFVFNRCEPSFDPSDADAAREHYRVVIKEIWKYAVLYRTPFKNFKYHIQRLIPMVGHLTDLMPQLQCAVKSYLDCLPFLGITESDDKECLFTLCRDCAFEVEFVPASANTAGEPLDGDAGEECKRMRVETVPDSE